jgi:hypothetical protein
MKRAAAVVIGLLIAGGAVAESRQGPSQAVGKPVGSSQSGPEQAGRPTAPAPQAGAVSPSSQNVVHRDVAARSGVATGAGAAAGAAAAPAAAAALPGGAVISAREASSGQATGKRVACGKGGDCDDTDRASSASSARTTTTKGPARCSSTDPDAACGDTKSVRCPDGTCATAEATKKN